MIIKKYLDLRGVTILIEQLRGLFALKNHTHNDATSSNSGFMSKTDKQKLDKIASGAEVNQNAFSNVKVGTTTVSADSKTDTLEYVAGSNVQISADATTDKITISATNTTYGIANASTAGIGKLYTAKGSATDGSMTQKAISDAINSIQSGSKNIISTTEPSCNVNDEWLRPY